MTTHSNRRRARDLGIPFTGSPGPRNSITDIPGVEVGYSTLIDGEGEHAVRTGVTAILPRGRHGVGRPATAGIYSMNGNGELTGSHWIEESGLLALPIGLTNSHAVGTVHRGIIDWLVANTPKVAADWLLPVVGETYDGDLNDINGRHVREEHAVAAIDSARSGHIAEGNVGGGVGMSCYEFKGGSGTSSRVVQHGADRFHVGAFVQANFGSREELVIAGVPIGRNLPTENPVASTRPPGGGSVIAIVATDAPLLPGQCKALARRVPLGLGRTGTTGSHFSGDIFLAFSVAAHEVQLGHASGPESGGYDVLRHIPWSRIDPFYQATVEAIEEAVVNVLCAAKTMTGRNGFRSPAMPVDQVLDLLSRPA
jgi:L-aminopeptidase/D-esterase-like protein